MRTRIDDGRIKHQADVINTVLAFCKKYPNKKKEMVEMYGITKRTINRWIKTENDKSLATKVNESNVINKISLATALNNIMTQLHGEDLKLVINEYVRVKNEIDDLKKDSISELKTGMAEHYQWCQNHYKPKNSYNIDDNEDWIEYEGKIARIKFAIFDICQWLDDYKKS